MDCNFSGNTQGDRGGNGHCLSVSPSMSMSVSKLIYFFKEPYGREHGHRQIFFCPYPLKKYKFLEDFAKNFLKSVTNHVHHFYILNDLPRIAIDYI